MELGTRMDEPQHGCRKTAVVAIVVVVVVVFTLNRSFYPTTSAVHLFSASPDFSSQEIQILWSQTENREKSNKVIASKSRKVGKSNANVTDTIALVRRRFENRLHLISSSKMVSWFLQSFCSI